MSRTLRVVVAALACAVAVEAQAPGRGGAGSISQAPLREWLTYIASDELQGRELYSEGLGLAASYIARHLEEWGVRPAAGDGDYFQTVKIVSAAATSRSRVILTVGGESRSFEDGEGITLPRNMGGAQTFTTDDVQFVGYGLPASAARAGGAADANVRGKVAVWLGASPPKHGGEGVVFPARARTAVEHGAIATIGPRSAGARAGGAGRAGRVRESEARAAQRPRDFTSAARYDLPAPPAITAGDDFFEFLFSRSPVKYRELQDASAKGAPLPGFRLEHVQITFEIEPEYAVTATRFTRNVVGVIEGSDPQLKDTYVAFGAHYDHIGYEDSPSPRSKTDNPGGCAGQSAREPRPGDIIYNGADDDGSGTVALMAIARAFARGPRPKRSLVFVWHSGEESGLHGSRYNADHPVVPNDRIVAQLNVDMVGRNRCDDPAEANTVYLIGSDRISTELHNISEDANASLPRRLALDYELNDPADPQALYTRSDHYSYAAKGIPVIFYTTGLHRDYHWLTDEVERIEFEKLARVTQLIYATGARLANMERAPVRDNKGPRVGRGTGGKLR
jgi:hypothetical protein